MWGLSHRYMWIIYGYYSVLPSQNWENEDCMTWWFKYVQIYPLVLWHSLNIAHFEWKLLETHLPNPYIYYLYMGGSTNGDCMIAENVAGGRWWCISWSKVPPLWEIENHLRCYICYCSIFWGGCFCFWLHVKWVFVDGNGELACISNHINNKADRSGALWLQPPDLSHFTPAFSAAAGPSGNRFKLWRLKNIRHDRTDHNC